MANGQTIFPTAEETLGTQTTTGQVLQVQFPILFAQKY